ncbi:MAG: PQQ-binding-like beta-propeller repeat protein [Verrucomicrobiota bacterium]|nr:PQQ-binding-like beta-propeller repeat protein [Verrucomicrobiota bacterium]
MQFRTVLLLAAALGQAAPAQAVEWPQWRGPTRDGVLPAKGLPLTTLPDQAKVLWKFKSGEGLASPVVIGGSVFLFENRNGNETMVALSIADGSEQWATELSPVFEDGQGPRGPRCTPVVEGGQVFAQCSRGTLHCLDAKSGKIRWEIDYAKLGMTFVGEKGRVPGARRHGFTNAPLVVGGMVYVLVGGKGHGIVCFNRTNGKVIWNALDYEPGYAPPIPAVLAGRQQFVCFFVEGVVGVDVRNGSELWKIPMKTDYGRHVAAPVTHKDMVVAGSHQVGLQGIRITKAGNKLAASVTWKNIEAQPNITHGVRVGGHYYGLGDPDKLVCVDIATGKTKWNNDTLFFPDTKRAMAAFIVMGGNILSLSSGGELCLFEASPKGFNELGRTQVCGINWCMPAYVDGKLFVRDGIRKKGGNLICIDLTK